MKLLFLGESWQGSSARTLKEAMRRTSDASVITIDEINEDSYFPTARARWLRAAHRLLGPAYRNELAQALIARCRSTQPDALVVYKGYGVGLQLVKAVKTLGILTVNMFPDLSPWVHGRRLRDAIGGYDLVISAKAFHPGMWNAAYGYRNACVFVAHGYDPTVHLVTKPPSGFDFDIALVASGRPEYYALMENLAQSLGCNPSITVGIAGARWRSMVSRLPKHWQIFDTVTGVAYPQFARRARIVLAPVAREVAGDALATGDEDSSRTYELAAAHCFFIHRRTPYLQTVYDQATEVPMYDDVVDLARLVRYYLPRDGERAAMAAAAHARAVPAYSIDTRVAHVLEHIRTRLG
jgi:hypothetical protein